MVCQSKVDIISIECRKPKVINYKQLPFGGGLHATFNYGDDLGFIIGFTYRL